jgi:hypothetical protein
MGERPNRYWDDVWDEVPHMQAIFMTPSWGLVMPPSFVRVQDSFLIGIDPIDPITPKSEGDDLIFKTTPKYNL